MELSSLSTLTRGFATKWTKTNKTHRSKTQIPYPFSLSLSVVKNEIGRGMGLEMKGIMGRDFYLEID
jgi:hypothetical protein